MKNLICFIKGIWESLPQWLSGGYPISGHLFVDKEEHENCKVIISECENCGEIHISWRGGNDIYR